MDLNFFAQERRKSQRNDNQGVFKNIVGETAVSGAEVTDRDPLHLRTLTTRPSVPRNHTSGVPGMSAYTTGRPRTVDGSTGRVSKCVDDLVVETPPVGVCVKYIERARCKILPVL